MKSLTLETHLECLRLLRLSEALVPSLALPLVFYWLTFGLFAASGYQALAGIIIIAAMSPGAFSGAIYVAAERQAGWLGLRWQFNRWRWWLSKQLALAFMAILTCLPVLLLAVLLGHVTLSWLPLAGLLLIGVTTSLLFASIGIIFGLWFSESGAIAMVNLLFFPLVLASGIVIPLAHLPSWLAPIAQALPPHQLLLLSNGQLHPGLILGMILLLGLTAWSMRRCTV